MGGGAGAGGAGVATATAGLRNWLATQPLRIGAFRVVIRVQPALDSNISTPRPLSRLGGTTVPSGPSRSRKPCTVTTA